MFQIKILNVSLVIFLSYLILIPISYAANTYKVKSADNLDRIVNKFYKDSKLDKHQIYIGILAESPNAFSLGNINYLKKGQLLNLPDSADLLLMEAKDATILVLKHNANASKGNKTRMDPPFKDYSPKKGPSISNDLNVLTQKQQVASQQLKDLNSESEALRIRLEQLSTDKEAMDAELDQLNSLIKQ